MSEKEYLKDLILDYILGKLKKSDEECVSRLIAEDSTAKSLYDEYRSSIDQRNKESEPYDDDAYAGDIVENVRKLLGRVGSAPGRGEVWTLKGFNEKVLVLDEIKSDESVVYRVMVLSDKVEFFAQKYDVVFRDTAFIRIPHVAHTHLTGNVLFERFDSIVSVLDSLSFEVLSKLDRRVKIELPPEFSYGKGVDPLLFEEYDDWCEFTRCYLMNETEAALEAIEGKPFFFEIPTVLTNYIDKRIEQVEQRLAADTYDGAFDSPPVLLSETEFVLFFDFDSRFLRFEINRLNEKIEKIDFFEICVGEHVSAGGNIAFTEGIASLIIPYNLVIIQEMKKYFSVKIVVGGKLYRLEFKENA